MKYVEHDIYVYDGARGAELVPGTARDPELASPERIEQARRAGIPEASFADFDIAQTAPGKYLFTDKATGHQYRRADEHDPLGSGDVSAARDISAFTIDAANRLHFLRRRGEPESHTRLVYHGAVYGREVKR